MCDLISDYKNQKEQYRKIFAQTGLEIQEFITKNSPKNFEGEIFALYENNSTGKLWQEKIVNLLAKRLLKIKNELTQQIKELRTQSHCIGCGTCCQFACSEFSPAELKNKAQNKDKTAQDFLQTFVPYQDMEEVRKVFPEYVTLLEANNENGYYFYHCPKVTQGNRCPDYENRPQICRDFPDNPTAFLPPKCGFKDWKLKSNSVSLKLSAEMEISLFYIEKIKGLYK